MPRRNRTKASREDRAPSIVETDTAETALFRTLDFFPSPPWSGRAAAEAILELCPDAKSVWEPACGEGHFAAPMREYLPRVHATDVYDHGFGGQIDFLSDEALGLPPCDFVATNPPFRLAQRFVERGLEVARVGVVVLCRMAFWESEERQSLFDGPHPLTQFRPFSERLNMCLGAWDPKASIPSACGLFIWIKDAKPLPPKLIPYGTKDRLSKADDIRRFAKRAPAPLLDI